MLKPTLFTRFFVLFFILSVGALTGCGALSGLDNSGSSSTSSSADETDDEETFLSMVEETSDAANSDASSEAFDGSDAVSSSESAYLSAGLMFWRPRHCDDGIEYESVCDDETGTLTATVTFDLDCEIVRANHTVSVEGEQEISFSNFSDACNSDGETIDLSKAVLGKDGENLVFTRSTPTAITRVISGLNEHELEVDIAIEETYYDAADEDGDGVAESAYVEMTSKQISRLRYKNDELKRDIDVFVSADGFTLEDGTVIETSKPIHFIGFDEGIDERVIQPGSDLIVDNNAFNIDSDATGIRRLFTVTSEDGLKFTRQYCTPYEGSVTARKFVKNADGSIGEEDTDATATMTWSEGTLTIELADGTSYELNPRPACTDEK